MNNETCKKKDSNNDDFNDPKNHLFFIYKVIIIGHLFTDINTRNPESNLHITEIIRFYVNLNHYQ
ncbi:hypothetical protein BLOT_007251 [Blomia tropicalis]|nr:hypothetical protein BLOT_007251 [Blomia tropicalis]